MSGAPALCWCCLLLHAAGATVSDLKKKHEAIARYLAVADEVAFSAYSDGSSWGPLTSQQQREMDTVRLFLEGSAASLEPGTRDDALNDLGVLWALGHGVAPEAAKAADYFTEAIAYSNHTLAKVNLGVLTHQGRGVPRDDKQAAALFSQACASDHPDAYYMLATLFRSGCGVKQSFDMAFHLFTMASNHNHTRAMYMLGLM